MNELRNRFAELLLVQRDVPTTWTIRQRDALDQVTKFIYRSSTLEDVRSRCAAENLDAATSGYAQHRWKNFVRHDAWLELTILTVPGARMYEEPRHRTRDLYLPLHSGETVFDLKVTRWPSRLPRNTSLEGVAHWMYENQSQQGRYHLDNRLFVVGLNETALCDYENACDSIENFWSSRDETVFVVPVGDSPPTAGVILVSD